jgi:hypothetical protein
VARPDLSQEFAVKRIFACLLLLALLTAPAAGQTYSIITNAGTGFTDISGTGTSRMSFQDDALSASVPLGFTFTIYGTTYTNVVLSSNGNLQFGGVPTSAFTNSNLTTTTTTNNSHFVAPWWDDLDSSGVGFTAPAGSLFTQTNGSAGSRVFIAQWNQWGHNNDGGGGTPANTITFQAQLFEANGNIAFVYSDKVFPFAGFDNGQSATIGISPGPSNDPSRPVAQFSFDTASLTTVNDLLFTVASVPEPSVMALGMTAVAAGALSVYRLRRRKRARTRR